MSVFSQWMKKFTSALLLRAGRRRNVTVVVSIALVTLIAATVYARLTASANSSPLVRVHFIAQQPAATSLVVLMHGYQVGAESLKPLAALILATRPDADLLVVQYPSQTFSNADPRAISAELCDKIETEFTRHGQYKDVILLGHSGGALLLRKAFLCGRGQTDTPGLQPATRPTVSWVKHVERIVLLAGMNRGWSLDPAPAEMSWYKRWLFIAGKRFAKLTGTGKFISGMERGAPFVADLRVQWLREYERTRRQPGGRFPDVIQYLGTRDDVVTDEDNQDVSVTTNFIRVKLHGTGHGNILDLTSPDYGAERSERISRAFDRDLEPVRRVMQQPLQDARDASVTDVVFIMHGIRDWGGEWTGQLETELIERFRANPPPPFPDGTPRQLRVIRSSYGYFPMLPFLLWNDRQRNVRWFMDQYTEALAEYPNADGRISYIGHSNGTYILASALENYQSLSVDKVVFAGSVVRTDYNWNRMQGRVGRVKNYVADADWVVAIFPKLFESFGIGDLGSAGFNGFQQDAGKRNQVEFIKGGHGAGIDAKNFESIAEFTLNGVNVLSPQLASRRQPRWLVLTSNSCWFAWMLIVGAILFVAFYVIPRAMGASHLRLAIAEAAYLIVLILLLHTL